MEKHRQEVLLKEYEICQQHNDSIGSQVWVSTTIFLSINVTLLGGVLYSLLRMDAFSVENLIGSIQFPILVPRGLATALGIGIIVILCFWKRWLKRMRFRTAINFERMGTIEDMLGMQKHKMCRRFDLDYKYKGKMSQDDKRYFERESSKFKYFPASGFDGLIWIARTLTVLWALSIVCVWLPIIIVSKGC